MLLYGTANPEGFGSGEYDGIYLTTGDIDHITPSMVDIPVKVEHSGTDVGRVISSWKHQGRMELLLDIDESKIQGAFVRQFVENGICKDLSLGYKVQMSKNSAGKLVASNKKVIEVSIVIKGARNDCHIRGWNQTHKILI
jgi:tRNA 2-selenouridine synthase SelU